MDVSHRGSTRTRAGDRMPEENLLKSRSPEALRLLPPPAASEEQQTSLTCVSGSTPGGRSLKPAAVQFCLSRWSLSLSERQPAMAVTTATWGRRSPRSSMLTPTDV